MTERNSFNKDTILNNDSGFTRIKFGIDKPILEVELNELQKIQENARTSMIRKSVPTGFLERIKKEFNGEGIIYNPTITKIDINGQPQLIKKLNSLAIAPAKLMVNGYEVELEGSEEIDGIKGYTLIELSNDQEKYNFLFLELWFEEINSLSTIYKNGFLHGEIIDNNIVDDRVGEETSRRVVLRHKIRIQKTNNYINDLSKLNAVAQGPLSNYVGNDVNFTFLSATNDVFKGNNFYGDSGLYIAGRKDYKNDKGEYLLNKTFGVLENYIFAVPLFTIKKRNKKQYSQSNPDGATTYVDSNSVSDRPDGLFNNLIDKKDIIDLRKTISFGQINTTELLEENLKKLMTGNLNTNLTDKVTRVQFGIPSIEYKKEINPSHPTDPSNTENRYVSNDNYKNNAIMHLDFSNQSIQPKIGAAPTTNGGDINYHLSASGYGLSLDGNLTVEYPISNFDKDKGTIEFLLKPYWDGADENISQTIFSIINETNIPLMQLVKEGGKLFFRQKHNNSNSSFQSVIEINLNNTPIYNNEIYHIRLSWTAGDTGTVLSINGKEITKSSYGPSTMTPHFVKLGSIENINSYSPNLRGCLIDEFIIYNKRLVGDFIQISEDITGNEAKIYNSFNGKLTGFHDNENKQNIISTIYTTIDSSEFILKSPYGTKIDITDAIVYHTIDSKIYNGIWEKIDESNVKFKLVATPNNSNKFNGETLWITHSVLVPGGLGIKEVPTRILKSSLEYMDSQNKKVSEDVSFAGSFSGIREINVLGESGIQYNNQSGAVSDFIEIDSYTAYDYSSTKKGVELAFARLVECNVKSNGTNTYKVPNKLFGREVVGIKYVGQTLNTIYKDKDGVFTIELTEELTYFTNFKVEIALGGFTFDYETHTKSLVSNIMKSTTIKIPTTGNQKEYIIPANKAISNSSLTNGVIVTAFLNLNGQDENKTNKNFGQSVFVTGQTSNYFATATLEGIGTPFIKVVFEDTPIGAHNIEIPVLITYQPVATEILSVWYEYSPYQGILTDVTEKKIKRFSDWKVFATTFGSGKVVTNNISERSINNASNRLPGGQNYSYLLDGKDINFVTEQMSVSGRYTPNKKLLFRTQFTELIENNEYDVFSNSLNTEFTIKKKYGKNYQDAFIESSINNLGFIIQDTIEPINKYLGAACLVIDEEGNIFLFLIGEVVKQPTTESIIRPVHGDLFKLEGNPTIIPRNN